MRMLTCHSGTGLITREPIRKPDDQEVAWIRLKQPTPAEVQDVLADQFRAHPLLVEDAVKLNQRPKLDRYKTHIFLTFFAIEPQELKLQEIGIVLGPNYVITISQDEIPYFDALEAELLRKGDMMDHSGEILYHIVDRCVDAYSEVVQHYEEHVERLERLVYRNPYIRVAHDIFRYKRRLHQLRKIFVEEKTILGAMSHQQLPYISQEKDVYFIDVYDHISRVIDSIDMFRESLTGLLELQMAMKSDRMNEIMKTLTILSSLFLPLTFIAGVYGMNFRIMPELDWSYGYAYVWVLMVLVSAGMFWYYKRKKWM